MKSCAAKNAKLKEEREEWERRLNGLLSKFESLETSNTPN